MPKLFPKKTVIVTGGGSASVAWSIQDQGSIPLMTVASSIPEFDVIGTGSIAVAPTIPEIDLAMADATALPIAVAQAIEIDFNPGTLSLGISLPAFEEDLNPDTLSLGLAISNSFTAVFVNNGVVPTGLSGVVATVEAWAGGGGGGAANVNGGGGGGGGAYSAGSFTLTAGETITSGNGGAISADGTDSWYRSTATLLAKAGLQGVVGAVGGQGAGGAGGLATGGVGTTKHNGGNGGGGGGVATNGGGGGGGSGSTADGTAGASAGTAGAGGSLRGGNGGTGATGATPATASQVDGGGGGGASTLAAASAGKRGEVRLTFSL